MGVVEAPLMLEKRFQMLCKGWWKPLKLEPCWDSRCFVHVGVEKNVEVWWEM